VSETPVVQSGSPRVTGGGGTASTPRGRVVTGKRTALVLAPEPVVQNKPAPTPGKTRTPTKEELKKAASKVQQLGEVKGVLGTHQDLGDEIRRIQTELLAFARVFLPSWAQPFVVSMINAMHTVEALEMRVQTFYEGLALNPPQGLMDLLARLKHAARPIEQPVEKVPVAPEVKTFVAPGTGADYQPSTGITFRSMGRGRPLVGVV